MYVYINTYYISICSVYTHFYCCAYVIFQDKTSYLYVIGGLQHSDSVVKRFESKNIVLMNYKSRAFVEEQAYNAKLITSVHVCLYKALRTRRLGHSLSISEFQGSSGIQWIQLSLIQTAPFQWWILPGQRSSPWVPPQNLWVNDISI